MKLTKYVYKNPVEDGFVLTGISLSDLYKLGLGSRGSRFLNKVEVYYKPEVGFIIQYFLNTFGKIMMLSLAPFHYLIELSKRKEITKEIKGLLNQKQSGDFGTDICKPGDKMFPAMLEMLNSNSK